MTWIQNFSLMQKTIYFITSAIHIESFHHKIFKLQFFFLTNPNKNFYSFFNWIKKLTSVLLFSLPSSFHSFLHCFIFYLISLSPSLLHWTVNACSRNEQMKWQWTNLLNLSCRIHCTVWLIIIFYKEIVFLHWT